MKSWVLANARALNLKVSPLPWATQLEGGLNHFHAQISFEERTFNGFGFSHCAESAFVKATAEALERSCIAVSKLLSSSGVAVHTNPDVAGLNAYFELLERDLFFCHYLSNTPFKLFSPDVSLWPSSYQKALATLEKSQVKLVFGQMGSPNHYASVACAAFGAKAARPFGVIVGLGCEAHISNSTMHAFCEVIGNVAAQLFCDEAAKPLSFDEFSIIKFPSPHDHLRWGLSQHAANFMEKMFSNNETVYDLNEFAVSFETLKFPAGLPENCPLTALRAYSKILQSAFFGVTDFKVVNLKRIQEFCQTELSFNQLNLLPHPLG
jgi:ribosomal protein S12 methylthiotransferase accessory factor YcaO